MVRELALLYEAAARGRPSPLATLPIRYGDYAAWQRSWLSGGELARQLAYWQEQLEGAEPLALPTDHVRPPVPTRRGARLSFELSSEIADSLRALSRREEVTLFMAVLAAFDVLLARYSGQRDISVGTPIANRTHAELEGLIGLFANTLVLRADLRGEPTFRELLARVKKMTLDAYAHQDAPFEKVVEAVAPERSLNRSPLFEVMCALQNAPVDPLRQLPTE